MRGEGKTGDEDTAIRLTRGLAYIERHIADRMSLAEVAREAALSDHHFHRLFRARFGVPVMDYVRRRRLTQAAQRLVRTSDAIVAIALDTGFESQAAFTRAFRRIFHTTPAAYRSRGREVPWLSAVPLDEETLSTLPELRQGAPRLERVEEFRVAGLSAILNAEGRARIPQMWARLAGLLGPDAFRQADRFGISASPFAALHGTFRYVAAVAAADHLPMNGLAALTIPAGTYLVFAFSGAPARLPAAIDYLFGIWIPASGHVLRWAPSFERYPKGSMRGDTVELELCLPVE